MLFLGRNFSSFGMKHLSFLFGGLQIKPINKDSSCTCNKQNNAAKPWRLTEIMKDRLVSMYFMTFHIKVQASFTFINCLLLQHRVGTRLFYLFFQKHIIKNSMMIFLHKIISIANFFFFLNLGKNVCGKNFQ